MISSILRQFIPPISQTEQEALESGATGWEAEIFTGNPNWDKILKDLPKPTLTAKEQAFLDGPVEQLCEMVSQWEINNSEEADLSPEAWAFIKHHKFLGMEVPEHEGGLGFSHYAHSTVIMKLASRSVTLAVSVMVPNSLGPAELIHRYGTKEQKDYYLPRLAQGQEVPCFALTEPGAGSDATSIESTGTVFKDADGDLKIRLNWEKRYITLGPISTLLGLAFQLKDPDNLLGRGTDIGITVALIPTDTQGVDIGNRHRPSDIPFQNGPNRGRDVVIPVSSVIGGAENVGKGWKMLVECLGIGRCISLPSLATAGSKMAALTTGAYSRVRRQFGLAVGKFEGVEEALARIAAYAYISDASRILTLQTLDDPKLGGKGLSVSSAIMKYWLTEMNRTTTNDSMDVHGGKAICQGPNNYLATNYQAMPIGITVEGANIMTRTFLIFGQGLIRAHPYMLDIMKGAQVKNGGFKHELALMGLVSRAVGSMLWNGTKRFTHSLTGDVFASTPSSNKHTKRFFKNINSFSAAFNFSSSLAAFTLGGELKRKEHLSKRFGDALSHLYMGSAVLRHHELNGTPKEDQPIVDWACQHSLYKAEEALADLYDNYPNRFLGGLMRFVTMPLGRRYKKPSDELGRKVAATILNAGDARDRLTQGVFVSKNSNDILNKLGRGFLLALEADEIEKKIGKAAKEKLIARGDVDGALAKGIISQEEFAVLRDLKDVTRDVIMVDEFTSYSKADSKPVADKKLKVA